MRRPPSSGTSMIELLVCLTITMAFAAVLHSFSRTIFRGAGILEGTSECQEAARIGIQLITRDLRGAGFHARGREVEAVELAHADSVGVSMDLNGDGDVADANERIAYSLDPAKRALMRTLGDGSPQPMLNDLAPDGLRFSYFDANGQPLSVGTTGLAEEDRAAVRRIDVTLRIEAPNPDPSYSNSLRQSQRGTIWLRNGPRHAPAPQPGS